MDRFYEESAADLMASYSRSRHAYETFEAPDDADIEDEADELLTVARVARSVGRLWRQLKNE